VKRSFGTLLLAGLTTCAGTSAQDEIIGPTDGSQPVAIVNVNVVPMDRERVLQSQTVVIRNRRIVTVAPSGSVTPPSDAVVIDGRGRYLMPGLIDMHVHIRSHELEEYLKAGITTVRNMWGYEELVPIIRDIDAGTLKGPRIFSLTSGFDASPSAVPQTQISDNPAAVAALIDRQFALGFREVKVYQKLSVVAYDSIAAAARRKGMTFAGHLPAQVSLNHALVSGQRSIEHLGGYGVGPQLAGQVAATVQAGAYNCPTLAIITMLTSADFSEGRRTIVAALAAGGARLLVGTDSGIDRTLAGKSIYDELDLFVRAGLTPFQALLGATRTAAEYLGQSQNFGIIAEGMEADLILLGSDPLKDVGAVRGIVAVFQDGRIL
jgi:imidazolonepropionase-like amidohydrolase